MWRWRGGKKGRGRRRRGNELEGALGTHGRTCMPLSLILLISSVGFSGGERMRPHIIMVMVMVSVIIFTKHSEECSHLHVTIFAIRILANKLQLANHSISIPWKSSSTIYKLIVR